MFILDDNEIKRLTGVAQKRRQCSALRKMGIKFAQRLDGSPVVTKDAVLEYTGMTPKQEETATINFGAL